MEPNFYLIAIAALIGLLINLLTFPFESLLKKIQKRYLLWKINRSINRFKQKSEKGDISFNSCNKKEMDRVLFDFSLENLISNDASKKRAALMQITQLICHMDISQSLAIYMLEKLLNALEIEENQMIKLQILKTLCMIIRDIDEDKLLGF